MFGAYLRIKIQGCLFSVRAPRTCTGVTGIQIRRDIRASAQANLKIPSSDFQTRTEAAGKRRSRMLLQIATAVMAFGWGCGEGTGPEAPVASVTIQTANAVEVVPGGTQMLTAVPKDANGKQLSNRPATWSSSDESKVTVAGGLITGVAIGSATITATIGEKSGSVDVAVKDGGIAAAGGSSFAAQGGAVNVTVPPGAVAQSSSITVGPSTSAPANPRLLAGSAFAFGPPGLTFAQPVTFTIKYNPALVTSGNSELELQLFELVGTAWQVVGGSTANTTAKMVSGAVTRVGTYAVMMRPKVETVTIAGDLSPMTVVTTRQLTATLKDNEGTTLTRSIEWSSSNAAIASVDPASGLVTAKTPGAVTITASSDGKSSAVTISVVTGPPSKMIINAGDNQFAAAGGTVATPPSVKITDAGDNPAANVPVTFTVASGGGTITGASTTTNAAGIATVGSWALGPTNVPNTLRATSTSLNGVSVTFQASVLVPSALAGFAGNNQTARPGFAVPIPPAFKVTNASGIAVPGVTVSFTVTAGGGTVSSPTSVTNADGIATVNWTLGSTQGPNSLQASIPGGIPPVTYNATAASLPPTTIAINAGDGQNANAGSPVAVPPSVKITDVEGVGVPGVSVTFSIRSGGGSITGANTVTNAQGVATIGSWTLGIGGNSLFASVPGLSGDPVIFVALGTAEVQIVTFGDSNTDLGFAGTNASPKVGSYVSGVNPALRLGPNAPNDTTQLAGKIESRWKANRTKTIRAVNHGITGTSTGVGRSLVLSPNALESVDGVTRFRGEVLGDAYPWSGGEPVNAFYPTGAIQRVQSFKPRSSDFGYISMGTNDIGEGASTTTIRNNLEIMVDEWISRGLAPNRLIITTIPPRRVGSESARIPDLNTKIRALAAAKGIRLIDISQFVSNDDGLTWKSASLHLVNDELHYAESVRAWIADQVVSIMVQMTPP